jgi:glycerophosphoryl diester phosphodiesterase
VVIHDATLRRTADVPGKVADLDSRALAKLDNRGDGPPWPNKRDTGTPTLSALVESAPEIRHWQLELKHLGKRRNPALAEATISWLRRHRTPAVVTSAEPELITAVKEGLPEQPTGFVSTTTTPEPMLDACGCDYLVANYTTLSNRALVRRLQKHNIHVSAWTVNDASAIEQLPRLGVDSIITDYPSMALPLVASLER